MGTEIARIPGVGLVSPEIWTRANIIDGKMIVSPPRFLFGADIPTRLALKQGVYRNDIVAGRFLTESDRGTHNTVVSRPIAEEFHKTVGDTLTVNGYPLKIVGVYYCGSLLLDVAIILDINQVRTISRFGNDSVVRFLYRAAGGRERCRADAADSGRLQRAGDPAVAALLQPRTAHPRQLAR